MGVDVNLVIGEGVRVGIGLGVGKGLNTMGVGLRTTIGPTVGTGLGFGLGVAVGAGAGAPGRTEQARKNRADEIATECPRNDTLLKYLPFKFRDTRA